MAIRKVNNWAIQLKISDWIRLAEQDRDITVTVEDDLLAEESKLDGCYVLKSDLSEAVTKEIIHDRYKDLALVESAFRTCKTVNLELRPIHVRLAMRTRGHAFVVMVAYKIIKELYERWKDLDLTIQEGIDEFSTLCAMEVMIDGQVRINNIPHPRESLKRLLDAARVKLPESLPCKGIIVTTKKKLPSSRIKT